MPKFPNSKLLLAFLVITQQTVFCGPPRPDTLPTPAEDKVPSVEDVRARLKSPDAAERGMAAAEVLRYSYRELTADLLKILQSDSSDNARTAAAIALAALGEQKAGAEIAAMLRARRGQTDLLIEALGDLRNPAHGAVAVPLLKYSDSMVRLKAAEALGKMQAKNQGAAILAQASGISAPEILEAHIVALGNIGYSAAENFLIKTAEQNPQSTLATAALHALGKLKSRKAIPLLLNALKGSDAKLQENAAQALRLIPDSKSAAGLFAIFETHVRPSVKDGSAESTAEIALLAIDILADYPAQLTENKAIALLKHEEKAYHAGAAFLLGKQKNRSVRERIEAILRDKSTPNREMVARALGYLNLPESISVLREVAREPEGSARYGAIWSLGIMVAREALPEIRSAVKSSDRQLVAYGLEALAAMPAEEDLSSLEPILLNDEANQLLAASVIARISGERARRVLENAAKSSKPSQRAAGFEGLRLRADKSAIPFLIQQLEKGDAETRKLSVAVLRSITGENLSTVAEWLNWYKAQQK